MNRYAAACCYFGQLPEYFDLWLESAEHNDFIDFIIFTDSERQSNKTSPKNVRFIYLTFKQLKERVQRKFPFKCVLPSPYKLCDYKFLYGDLFEEEFSGYDYFGWFDVDLIWGDMKKFFPTSEVELIGGLGHFTLIKNTPQLRKFYERTAMLTNAATPYTKVFKTGKSCYFDELYGLGRISCELVCKLLIDEIVDIIPHNGEFYNFHKEREGNFILKREDGCLYQLFSDGRRVEVCYAHMQKRNMKNEGVSGEYYIKPDSFSESCEYVTPEGDYGEISKKLDKSYAAAKRINTLSLLFKKIKRKTGKLFR